jgi:cystathionine gamma-synthase/methionine-gamma-lyase
MGGHGDVVGGVVAARSRLLLDLLRRYAALLGATLGPFEAAQILRGLKTLALRVRQQCANAAAVAQWLDNHPEVALVYYPGLPTHPQHELATRQFGGYYGALVAFDLQDGGRDALFRVVDRLKLILPATSLGDVYTLISMPVVASHRDLTLEQRAERGITDHMMRLSIGIEDAADLIADLAYALTR